MGENPLYTSSKICTISCYYFIWLNPPHSKSLNTNIGKSFFGLLNKHFSPGHKLYRIFSKNPLKIRYSCMIKLEAKMDVRNKKILENTPLPKTKLCNCLKKTKLPNEMNLPL